MMRETPHYAWYRVGVDIFQHAGSSYLCVYDAFSNFPEVEKLNDTTSRTVIEKLSCIFARYGIPLEVCSDNGPQFASHEFAVFASRYEFQHITSSPGFPQSNGLAEKGVQIVKKILKRTQETQQDFWLGLLSYRATPLEDGRSPGELLQGRRLRTRLPDFRRQKKTTVYKRKPKDTGAKSLPGLQKGQVVRVHDKQWTRKAQVVGFAAPRSYRVRTEDNQLLRRNRRHLSTTLEPFESSTCDESDSECEPVNEQEPGPRQQVPATSTSSADGQYTPRLRRSTRNRRPPNRLHYDRSFNQVN